MYLSVTPLSFGVICPLSFINSFTIRPACWKKRVLIFHPEIYDPKKHQMLLLLRINRCGYWGLGEDAFITTLYTLNTSTYLFCMYNEVHFIVATVYLDILVGVS